jgi:hypothetical protein
MKINMSGRGKVEIDGKGFIGNSIQISGDKVIVDGKVQEGSLTGVVNVEVYGDVSFLENESGDVRARNVGSINTGSGDIKCADVSGSIRTGSGDVECGNVSGSVRTGSGDLNHR